MPGSAPTDGERIRYEDGSFYRFPQWRWSFSHWGQFRPTVRVAHGAAGPTALPAVDRPDLDEVRFTPLGGGPPMTWRDSLAANYTDGVVVLHRGRRVYERYFGALVPERPHIAFSVSKSFFGTLAEMLIAEGGLRRGDRVQHHLPELRNSAFGDATVGQVLDMTTAIDFDEDYAAPSSRMLAYRRATGFLPRGPDDTGPGSIREFLPTVERRGEHGRAFVYRTPNTDVVGWLIARVTGQSAASALEERIWSRLGAEDDALLAVDADGTPLAGSGLNTRLRDLARFGELMRRGGLLDGVQVVPTAVVESIRRGGSRDAFAGAGYGTLPGWSYRAQWWVANDDHGVFMARGIHGQAIYVDPTAETVIARYASHPLAGNANLDPTSLPAYRALARHLMEHPA